MTTARGPTRVKPRPARILGCVLPAPVLMFFAIVCWALPLGSAADAAIFTTICALCLVGAASVERDRRDTLRDAAPAALSPILEAATEVTVVDMPGARVSAALTAGPCPMIALHARGDEGWALLTSNEAQTLARTLGDLARRARAAT